MKRFNQVFILWITILTLSVGVPGTYAQTSDSEPEVQMSQNRVMLQVSLTDTAAFGVMDSAAAAGWESRLEQARTKAGRQVSLPDPDINAYLKLLLRPAEDLYRKNLPRRYISALNPEKAMPGLAGYRRD